MEAATTIPLPRAQVHAGRLHVDGLVVDDETLVRLAQEREDPLGLVIDALTIGARVLDREQVGANAEFVRTEFERASRELEAQFAERARGVAERMEAKLEEAFGPETGHVERALARHFSDESSGAVQHRVRAALAEVLTHQREDLLRHFSSADSSNPLADFKRMSQAMMREAADRQERQLRDMSQHIVALRTQVQGLQAERELREAVEAEAQRGTAKGRTYEEAVFEAVDAIAHGAGDVCEAVGDLPGVGGRKGDVVIALEAVSGPERGRVVFEAKNSKLSRNAALAELDAAMAARGADFAVLVVPGEDRLPARTHPLREYNGDKLLVTFDPAEGSRLALEVAYGLARARVLMKRGEASGLDAEALRAELQRAAQAMEDVRRIKSQLTAATNGIDEARGILESMAAGVREHLQRIDELLATADARPASAGGDPHAA